jgi:hypothetical protein
MVSAHSGTAASGRRLSIYTGGDWGAHLVVRRPFLRLVRIFGEEKGRVEKTTTTTVSFGMPLCWGMKKWTNKEIEGNPVLYTIPRQIARK